MLIDGEKFACEACVRGHRVSNCQHNDRPLIHINKKGRPVSQCPHCRGLRKSRASHVKCECGEKPHGKDDCVHVEKGDPKLDHHICCCTHGSRCTCALKKDHLDPVPEIDIPITIRSLSSSDSWKPRLSTAVSDSSLTVFVNGHHKPVHKHNHAAHESGLPYKIPRPHSIHGHSDLAQKSMDHLPLARSVEHESSQLQDSIASAQQDVRLVRSEHGSPGPRAMPSYEQLNGHFSPLDPTSYPAFNNFSSAPMDEYNSTQISNPYDSYLATPEDQPPFSAGASMPPVDWSAFDLPVDNGTLGPAYSQPPSYASFDHSNVGQPGLTTSSSSENEEYIQQGLPSPGISGVNHYSPASPEQTGGDSYRVTNGTSFLNMPPASILTNNAADGMSFGAFLQGGTASPSDLEEFNNSPPADPEAFTHHGLTVQDAQKMAHPGVPTEAMNDLRLPATRDDNNDPLWAASFDDAEEGFDALEEAPGVVWRS